MGYFSSVNGNSSLRLMIYHPVHDIWVYLLAAAVLLSLAVYTWRYRQEPPAMYLALGAAARVVWLIALVMITISPDFVDKIRWAVIHQLGALTVIPMVLMTALHLTGQRPVVIRAASALLLVLAGFFGLALLTGGWHEWYWRSLPWDGKTFGFVRGPLFWAAMAIAYLTIMITLVLYLRQAVRSSGLRRWQALAVPIDMLVSAAGHARWVTNPQTDPIPVLPLAFMLGGLVWFGIFFGLRVFNLQELAEATVTQDTNDCLIVADAQGYIVELNPAAEKLFGERTTARLGTRVAAAFAPWPALVELAESREARTGEFSVAGGHYLFRVSLLTGVGGRNIGKAIVLQDIGELKAAQAQILDQEKALSVMAERDRLGRELHDGQGQVWGYINMQVEAARSLLAKNEPVRVEALLAKLAGVTRDVHVDIRESITGLRAAATADGQGLWRTLADYLQWFRENNAVEAELTVEEELRADWQPSPTTEVQLLRIVQEALTNVRKHADARRVRVSAWWHGETVEIRVVDDGRGFDPAAVGKKDSYGLRIMEERAGEAGGRLRVESALGAGTTVIITLPQALERTEEERET